MIAEDEAIIRLDLRELLEEEGYEVVGETGRGDEAIDLVRELRPDLAILDIKMPGLDGLSAARQIAGERLAAVLILTAFSQRDLVEQARDAGALAYLVKPFQKSDLLPAIEIARGRFAELAALEREVGDLQGRTGRAEDRRPSQGPADGRARHDRAGRLALPPAAGDGEPGAGRRDRGTGRRRPAHTLKRSYAGRTIRGMAKKSGEPALKLLLIDGLSLAFRAFYALPTDLATPNGTVTNAVYGFTSMLVKVLTDERPDEIVVVFDAPGRTFRDDLDGEYKAGRKETPDLFVPQLPLIHEVIDALRIPTLEVVGVEADDVIATLATRAAEAGSDVIVVTGDRDAYQLVEDPHIKVLYNRRGVSDYVLYDEAGILERTGVTAGQYPEYAALRGDPSDNLPGVPGVGEKTAAKLVSTYGDLEGIFEHLDELPPKQRQNLGEARDRVFLNRQMSLLVRDVPLDVDPGDLRQGPWDREEVRLLFDQLAFRTLMPRLLEGFGETSAAVAAQADTLDLEVEVMRDAAAVLARFGELTSSNEPFALEPRWDGAPVTSPLRAIGLAHDDRAAYIDADLLRDPSVRDALVELVSADGPPLVAHRAKELMHGLDVDARVAARHRSDGVPPRSCPGEVRPRRSRAPLPVARGAFGRRRTRHPRSRRRRRDGTDRSAGRGRAAPRGRARVGHRGS